MNYNEETMLGNNPVFLLLDMECDLHECCRCNFRFFNFRQYYFHKVNQCQDTNVIQSQYYSNGAIESNNYETPINKQVTCIEGIPDYNQPPEHQMQFLCNQNEPSYHTMYANNSVSDFQSNNHSLPSISTVNSGQPDTNMNYAVPPIIVDNSAITSRNESAQNFVSSTQNDISQINLSSDHINTNGLLQDEDISTNSEFMQFWPPSQPSSHTCQHLDAPNTAEYMNQPVMVIEPNLCLNPSDSQKSNMILLQSASSTPLPQNYIEESCLQTNAEEISISQPSSTLVSNSVVKSNNPKPKHKCKYCEKSFNKNFDLIQHVRSHTGEKPFQCVACGRAFAQKSNVKKHMASHKVWLKGDYNRSLTNDANDISDNIDLSFLCQYCGKTFSSYNKRKTHLATHKDKQVYKCPKEDCSCTFKDLEDFVGHIKSHGDEMTYRCHQCHQVFKTLEDIGLHEYQVHLDCSINKNVIPSKQLTRRLYTCKLCPSKFTNPSSLREHVENDEHRLPCHICQAVFTCERYLRKHLLLQHKKQDDISCSICKKNFKSVYYLRQHMLIHTKELPFQCPKCDSAFNRKDKMKRHMLIHETEKKYKCPFAIIGCTREFSRKDKLKEHVNTHKTSKQTFSCSFCGKKYSRFSFKNKHEQLHKNGLFCSFCKQMFTTKSKLKTHKCPGDKKVHLNTNKMKKV